MAGARKHLVRVVGRSLWLAAEMLLAAGRFPFQVLLSPNSERRKARARWFQAGCRRALRIFRAELQRLGPIPTNGLLVSNHLSYLDVVVLGALAPSVFVSKSEVRSWPVFGWFARLSGTLFVDRSRRLQAGAVADRVRSALDEGALVVLFPEGTSSDGRTVLPFKSSLLEAVAGRNDPVWAGAIQYELADGDVAEEVCYWKDMTFLPHLINFLGKEQLGVLVRFSRVVELAGDRKALARQLHVEVLRLKPPCSRPSLDGSQPASRSATVPGVPA